MAPHRHELTGDLADASVRVARPSDAPAVGQVQAQVFIDTYAARLPPEVSAAFDPTAFAKAWRASLESPPEGVHRLLVALAGAQVVGIAAYGPSQDRDTGQATGEITLLGVLLNACVDQLRDLGAEDVTIWLPADLDEMRAFLLASGLGPDGAYRDRIVSPDGATLREVRLHATLSSTPADAAEALRNDG